MSAGPSNEAKHPIQVVSLRTGLSQDVIRVWERRYDAVTPRRTQTNRRLYSDADIHRLRLLRRAIAGGRRIGDVAGFSMEELERMVANDDEAAALVEPAPRVETKGAAGGHLAACLRAIEELSADRLEQELSRAAVNLPTPVLMERLLTPLLHAVGAKWRDGSLRLAHEHMATAVLRSFLGTLRIGQEATPAHPGILVATPAGQMHELGAMMAAITAGLDGWRVTYLGPNLPPEEIAAAARQSGSSVVALSVVFAADASPFATELRKLGEMLEDGVALIVGGAGARAHQKVLGEIGAIHVEDMVGFRAALDEARSRTT